MATESWVLDGVALTSGDFTLMELEANPPKGRPEWVTAADSEGGALARQPLPENRVISMKLRVTPQASMDAAMDKVGALVDKLRKASRSSVGVPLVWTPADSTRARTFDVLDGQVTEMPIAVEGQGRSWLGARPIVAIELTCRPYWYGTEVLTSTATSGTTPIATLEIPNVPGDVPALGRLIVTDTATQNRRHLEWGLENQYYSAATSLLIDSDAMTVAGFGGAQVVGLTGAYDVGGGNTAIQGTLYTTPVAVCGTGNLTHVGDFRIKARVNPSSLGVALRFAWHLGDGSFARNSWSMVAVEDTWTEVDLGMIRINPVTAGTQRWRGQIEAYSTTNLDTVQIDYIVLVPLEGYGLSRSSFKPEPGIATGFDKFEATTAGGALTGRVAPLGGTWSTAGSGALPDFQFSDLGVTEPVIRSAVSDTGRGRTALLSATTYTDTEVAVNIAWGDRLIGAGDVYMGAVARYVDDSNMLRAYLKWVSVTAKFWFEMAVVSAAANVTTARVELPGIVRGPYYRIVLIAHASGFAYAELRDASGNNPLAALQFTDSRLATAGSHATGRRGFNDYYIPATPTINRYYDDVYAGTPAAEPVVLYSGRIAQVRHDATIRQDSTGTYYGQPPSYNGSRFLVPPGTSRVLVKARRQDVSVVADGNVTDATQIQVGYTPRGLAVPR